MAGSESHYIFDKLPVFLWKAMNEQGFAFCSSDQLGVLVMNKLVLDFGLHFSNVDMSDGLFWSVVAEVPGARAFPLTGSKVDPTGLKLFE